jgi:hypothetical protein
MRTILNASNRQFIKIAEHMLIVSIWALIFAVPILVFNGDADFQWMRIRETWAKLFPFLLIFMINHYVSVPFLLFRKKNLAYVLVSLFTVLLFGGYTFLNDYRPAPKHDEFRMIPEEFLPESKPQPPVNGFNPMEPRGGFDMNGPGPSPLGSSLLVAVVGLLIVGFDTGLRTTIQWSRAEKEKGMLQQEKTESQLAFLRHQISPHFFMNTLNNIHSLIDIDHDEAKQSVIQLSQLMRYLLYQTNDGVVDLKQDIEFIKSYIRLMKLRFSSKVKIEVNIPDEVPQKKIAPLLFTSVIENAFKHGISYEAESFVKVNMLISQTHLIFESTNSYHSNKKDEPNSGIGVDNTKKRLELLYGNNFIYEKKETDNQYAVTIIIPINND